MSYVALSKFLSSQNPWADLVLKWALGFPIRRQGQQYNQLVLGLPVSQEYLSYQILFSLESFWWPGWIFDPAVLILNFAA